MELKGIYKCEVCGNVVEVVDAFEPPIFCCDEEMKKLEAQTEDYSIEKHVPIAKEVNDGLEVIVGSTLHPMTEDHQIVFIEVITKDNKVLRKDLTPNDEPKATFNIAKSEIKQVREYCNVHDLWKA